MKILPLKNDDFGATRYEDAAGPLVDLCEVRLI